MNFDLWRELGTFLLRGIPVTLEITALASIVALCAAFVSGTAQLAPWRSVRWLATVYIETFRGTSALVQLFVLFYVLPLVGVSASPLAVGVFGLGLCFGAYGSQIVRAGILAVDRGQRDAAVALHMTGWQTLRRIVMPQAIPLMLPPFGNELIEMLKSTPLVSLIALQDLTFSARIFIDGKGHATQAYATLLFIYFAFALPLSRLTRRLERRTRLAAGGLSDLATERPV